MFYFPSVINVFFAQNSSQLKSSLSPAVMRVAAVFQLFCNGDKNMGSNVSTLHTCSTQPRSLSWVLWLHLTFRDLACNPKLWMVSISGRGLAESNKLCHWINKFHMPWKHRQPLSDNTGMAACKSFIQTMTSNADCHLSSLKTRVYGACPFEY